MSLFYFDELLSSYEKKFQWDESLNHLQRVFSEQKQIDVLASLIGFSWFYLVEGPVVSKRYAYDSNTSALKIWKDYLDIGITAEEKNPIINFIAGYTLSLHGFYISEEYERKGPLVMQKCYDMSENLMLKDLAENFLNNNKSAEYIPLERGDEICACFFNGSSLLDNYFNEIYSS